jgi:hypothetical protein
MGLGLAATVCLGLIAATRPQASDLRARSLTIVDEKGTARVVIAAAVPDPMVGGKRMPRAGAGAGILLNGPDGNERGGYMVTDGGEGLLTLDDAGGREMFKVVANPDSGASLFVQHQSGAWAAVSTYRGEPELQMVGRDGKRVTAIPADAPEMP